MKFLKQIFGLNGRLDRRGYLLFGVLPMVGWILLVDNFHSSEAEVVALILLIPLFILALVSAVKRGRDSGLNGLVTLLLFGAVPVLIMVLRLQLKIDISYMSFAFFAYLLLMPSSSKEVTVVGKVEYLLAFTAIIVVFPLLLLSLITPGGCIESKDRVVTLTCSQMSSMANTFDIFKLDNGVYPTTKEGFLSLISNPNALKYPNYAASPYYRKLPKDAWGNYFIYVKTKDGFELISYGADRKEGGEDEGADILYSECEERK